MKIKYKIDNKIYVVEDETEEEYCILVSFPFYSGSGEPEYRLLKIWQPKERFKGVECL